jgi:DedD protein
MEKKKILMVAVSVGVFLVIVIGAAILIISQRDTPVPAAGPVQAPIQPGVSGAALANAQPASADPAADISGAVQGLQPPPASLTANQENVFYFLGDNPDQIVQETTGDDTNRVVISVPKPASAAVPDAPPAAPKPAAARQAPAPRQAAPAAASRAVPRSAPAAAQPKASAPAQARNDYWVQTGSFSTRVRADGVKETLASRGISAIIENRDVGGKTYYRVRVGPYTSQNEADYWLSLIKTIQGFEDSQIWRNQSLR